jgi:hypothetical protein
VEINESDCHKLVQNIEINAFRDVALYGTNVLEEVEATSTLKTEAATSFEILTSIYQTTRQYLPEYYDLVTAERN